MKDSVGQSYSGLGPSLIPCLLPTDAGPLLAQTNCQSYTTDINNIKHRKKERYNFVPFFFISMCFRKLERITNATIIHGQYQGNGVVSTLTQAVGKPG